MSDTTSSLTPITSNTTEFSYIIDPKCRSYYNNTAALIKDYEGIPENLIVNLVVWFVLLVLFTFLRKIGDYGRFGLLKNDEERWSARFFGRSNREDGISIDENESQNKQSRRVSEQSGDSRPPEFARSNSSLSQDFTHASEYKEKNILSWMVHMVKLKDQHINEKCGKDAIYYLVFQRYLIVYLLIVTILSISVLLPININGTALSNNRIFGSTTIVNVLPNSSVLWVHLVLSWLFFILGIIFMRQFSKKMEYSESDYVSRTVLITGYPSRYAKTEFVLKHLKEAYPELVVTDVQFAYDVSKLNKLDERKRAMHIGKITSEKIYEQTNQRPLMHPFHFGSLVELCCCCCSRCYKDNNKKITDSINFYTEEETKLSVKIAECREKVLKKPLGIIFITFQDQKMAATFLKHYRYGFFGNLLTSSCSKTKCSKCYLCQDLPKSSSLSDNLEADFWSVKYAPAPNNIKWQNISKIGVMWWFRCILINLILIILMIFFTTPSILIEKFSDWSKFLNLNSLEQLLPSYLVEFLPSLLLRLLAALLPVLVAQTALAELHWTRSAENRSMMLKTFTLLLFMVLILPTLGLTSVNALLEWLNQSNDDIIKWRCVSDNGAFFLKYVTTCSLIGTALDLLRLPDLFLYVLKMLWSRSSAERLAVRMQAAFEFDYGVQYAWILTVFTVTLCFSVVCPLITPFGLVYLLLKHLVDRYNLYFAYVSTKVDKSIHKTAVKFTLASFIILQICILFFIAVRNKGNINTNAMSTVQTIIIFFSSFIFIGSLFFGVFKRFTPFNQKKPSSSSTPGEDELNNDTDYSYITNESSTDSDNQTSSPELTVHTEQPSPSSTNSTTTTTGEDLNDESILKENHIKTSTRQKRTGRKRNIILKSPFIPSIIRASLQEPYVQLKEVQNNDLANRESVLSQNEIDLELRNNSSSRQTDFSNYGTLAKKSNLFQQQEQDINSSTSDKTQINSAFDP